MKPKSASSDHDYELSSTTNQINMMDGGVLGRGCAGVESARPYT
jgi:hypothetical protein